MLGRRGGWGGETRRGDAHRAGFAFRLPAGQKTNEPRGKVTLWAKMKRKKTYEHGETLILACAWKRTCKINGEEKRAQKIATPARGSDFNGVGGSASQGYEGRKINHHRSYLGAQSA